MKYIMGNWKMNMLPEEAAKYMEKFNILMNNLKYTDKRYVELIVPTLDYYIVNHLKNENIHVGIQNMYMKESGAYTGEISPKMVHAVGADHILIGHSERREIFFEDNNMINEKLKAALKEGLNVVLCVGESLETYNAGKTLEFLNEQLESAFKDVTEEKLEEKVIIAYEPIWAIGTGNTCEAEKANEVCLEISKKVKEITGEKLSVLYGGSVNEKNAKDILTKEYIDGVLVGGASLDPDKFAKIVYAG